MVNDAYVPTIVKSEHGLPAVSLAAYDVEVTRLRRQRNAFATLAAILAVVALAAVVA